MEAALIGAAAAIVVALVTAVFAWAQSKPKGQAEFQTAVAASFNLLVEQLQEELKEAKVERGQLRQEAQITQSALRHEVRNLGVEVMHLKAYIVDLERLLGAHGIQFEPRPPRTAI